MIIIKKVLRIIIFLCLFCISFDYVYADDIDYEENEIINENEVIETSKDISKPTINSRRYVVFDRNSKMVLFGKNEDVKSAMASTTKIMTAIIVLEKTNLNDIVEVSNKAALTGGSRLGLKTNDKISVRDLLYGLMLKSGNDAAIALAEYVGGDVLGFANYMNQKAKEIGLENTHFVTPHGLDNSDHYTTAEELAILTDYALNNELFAKIVGTKQTTININGNPKTIGNTNELLGTLNGVVGVKTGFTNGAGRCLVTETKRDGKDIIVVVLGADTKKYRTSDSIKLIEYTFSNYIKANLKEEINNSLENWKSINGSRINVIKGKKEILDLSKIKIEECEIEDILLNKNNEKINININTISQIEAPVNKNETIGILSIKINDKLLKKLRIKYVENIEKKDFVDYYVQFLRDIKNSTFKSLPNLTEIIKNT